MLIFPPDCASKCVILGQSILSFVHSFVQPGRQDLVITISHERLEQSQLKLLPFIQRLMSFDKILDINAVKP